jgi:hypothetical protein
VWYRPHAEKPSLHAGRWRDRLFPRHTPDASSGATGQLAFYGLGSYQATPQTFNANVKINTPLTTDRYGNIYFGFQVTGPTTPPLKSGIARIAEDGTGTWLAANAAANDMGINKVVVNCAPALSNDHKTLYAAVSVGNYLGGYLVALDARTLAPISRVRLADVQNPGNDAILLDDGTSSPTIGPDGDVYFGAIESPSGSHNYRGWLLHYDAALTQAKPAGGFGWDQTVSIVPASLVPSYHGSSKYLLLSKYNNYAIGNSGGQNKVAILDPNDTMIEESSGVAIMKEVLTMLGPTPDADYPNVPGAVREWCINTVAIDPVNKCALHPQRRWEDLPLGFHDHALTQTLTLTAGIGESYTPSVIGVDGTVISSPTGSFLQSANEAMYLRALILSVLVSSRSPRMPRSPRARPAVQNAARGTGAVFSVRLANTSATEKVFLNDIHAVFVGSAATYLAPANERLLCQCAGHTSAR